VRLLGLTITRAAALSQERRSSLAAPTQWLIDAIRSVTGGSGEGVRVNQASALSLAAVHACVRVIAESVASMPLRFYGTNTDGSKFVDNSHPLSYLINEPNEAQTRYEFVQWMAMQLKLTGNAYAVITRDPTTQRPVELNPIPTKRVKAQLTPTGILYHIEGRDEPIAGIDMVHFRGMTADDLTTGLNPIQLHANSLGITIGAERSTARFYGKNASLKWAIKWKGAQPSVEAAQKTKQTFINVLEGNDPVTVLPDGTDLEQLNLSPQEAEFIAARKYGAEDIARMFGVPAYMIGADSSGIKSSVEQQAQDFYTQTILPTVTMMEQELRRKLTTEAEKGTYYFKFVFNSLLRADAKSRAEYYNMGIRGGWLSPNEARSLEDFNPMAGGETTYTESNLVPSDMMRPWIQSKIDAAPQAEAQTNNPDGDN
jgi:HK97 family phage portal protein